MLNIMLSSSLINFFNSKSKWQISKPLGNNSLSGSRSVMVSSSSILPFGCSLPSLPSKITTHHVFPEKVKVTTNIIMAVANIAAQRIKREIRDISRDQEAARCGVKIDAHNDQNWLDLRGEISGPPDTPYEGGRFLLEIVIPETYPFNPPKIKFLTKIWHPNISSVTGAVCVDILKDQWAAAMTLRTILLSLQALLSAPEPDDPQDAVVATQFKETHRTFLATARHWTAVYAGGPNGRDDYEKMVKNLVELGVAEGMARARLSQTNWDYQRAVDLCLNNN